jgi:nitrate reductase molybdenum cofactor assembly chaperone NarJ/NarW
MSSQSTLHRLYAIVSAMLKYPEEDLIEKLPQIRRATRTLSPSASDGIQGLIDWLEATPLLEAQAHYVGLFDQKRKACLYLSYFLNGDTRRRGMALVEFKELYRSAGWTPKDSELPDYLPTLLEFCVVGDQSAGETALAAHRSGIEVLWKALADAGSPYAGLIAALLTVVKEVAASEELFHQLVQSGPPTEMVGLEPFFPVESLRIGAH